MHSTSNTSPDFFAKSLHPEVKTGVTETRCQQQIILTLFLESFLS